MVIKVMENDKAIGKAIASLFAAKVNSTKDCVLGFATGSSPLPTYESIIELYKAGAMDFSGVTSFNLDEYVGLDRTHEQSYYRFMKDNLFSHVNMDMAKVNVPFGQVDDLIEEGKKYEAAIEAAGGIDLQILGIGSNGHIAFNEPTDIFYDITHPVDLTEQTIADNTRFFNSVDEVPRRAITMGIGSIMRAKEICLVATGANKAAAVRTMINGDIDPKCPASILKVHPNVTVFLDKDAASSL